MTEWNGARVTPSTVAGLSVYEILPDRNRRHRWTLRHDASGHVLFFGSRNKTTLLEVQREILDSGLDFTREWSQLQADPQLIQAAVVWDRVLCPAPRSIIPEALEETT